MARTASLKLVAKNVELLQTSPTRLSHLTTFRSQNTQIRWQPECHSKLVNNRLIASSNRNPNYPSKKLWRTIQAVLGGAFNETKSIERSEERDVEKVFQPTRCIDYQHFLFFIQHFLVVFSRYDLHSEAFVTLKLEFKLMMIFQMMCISQQQNCALLAQLTVTLFALTQ